MDRVRPQSRRGKTPWLPGLAKLVCLAALLVLAASPGLAQTTGSLVVVSSVTTLPLAQKVADAWEESRPGAGVTLSAPGTDEAVTALLEGTADLAYVSRALLPAEEARAAREGIKLNRQVLATDCLLVVVHPRNPVNDLSLAELRGLYAGDLRNWSQVGGKDKPVVVVGREPGSEIQELWQDLVLKGAPQRAEAQAQPSHEAVVQSVAGNKLAIGFISVLFLDPSLKAISLSGKHANPGNAKNGSYPLTRKLYVLTRQNPPAQVKEYLDYLLGPPGRRHLCELSLAPAR